VRKEKTKIFFILISFVFFSSSCVSSLSQHSIEWMEELDYSVIDEDLSEREFAFLEAAKEGEYTVVEDLLNAGININTMDVWKWTALSYSVREGNDNISFLLMGKGCDVNTAGKTSTDGVSAGYWFPIHLAAYNGRLAIVEALLNNGAEINVRVWGDSGDTPLHHAAKKGFYEVSRTLIIHGADINSRNEYGATPLYIAADWGNLIVAQDLITEGADVNISTESGMTPLHVATYQGFPSLVRLLINSGADVNARKINNWRPLHYAAREGDLEISQILISNGADINALGNTSLDEISVGDWTSLHLATYNEHPEVLDFLIHSGEESGVDAILKIYDCGHFMPDEMIGDLKIWIEKIIK